MTIAYSHAVSSAILVSALALSGCTTVMNRHSVSRLPAPRHQASNANDLIAKLHGGIIGKKIGSQLSSSDRRLALEAEYRALEDSPGGQPVTWQDPDGSVSGVVVAAPPYQVGSQNCRQYTHTVTINGAKEKARGAACRNKDGSWTPLT
ncbi:MAG TPA: RT0821/Lpp0805 family surface protein [Pararhizobium sp.]|nr:RT0821/Lpp0805 family surface protein [Pararhizobium sp.]